MNQIKCGLALFVFTMMLAARAADKLPENLFIKESPTKASDVGELKKSAKEGDEIVLRGQVGGQAKDVFNASRASMMVADMKLTPCNKKPGDTCETPWDFCCVANDEKAANIAIVQVVDEKGKLIKSTLKGANGLDHLSVVVVKGKVAKKDGVNLIVNATGIYVEAAEKK
ncbi:MAG TPA: hypothetical protein VKX17_19115 [Planctomycetota bacterium]|nr:hypothetical protein [Planctomycetota bacterium]